MRTLTLGFLFFLNFGFSQDIALLKYSGGGDWYANPTSLPNLVKFCNQTIQTKLNLSKWKSENLRTSRRQPT